MNEIQHLIRLHQEMRKEVIAAGIQSGRYDFAIKNLEKKTNEEVFALLGFFHSLHQSHYAEVIRIRAYRSEEFWVNVRFLFGQRKLREQKLLTNEQEKSEKLGKDTLVTQSKKKISIENPSKEDVA